MSFNKRVLTKQGDLFPYGKILLITPILKEFHAAREIFRASELHQSGSSRLSEKKSDGRIVRILQEGMGRTNLDSCKAQIKDFMPDLIIDSGSSGSLREDLAPGVILLCEKVVNESGSVLCSPLKIMDEHLPDNSIKAGILEVQQPVLSSERRNSLRAKSGVDACSMETYIIAEEASRHSIPWISFRIVTDFSNEQTASDFKKNIRQFSLLLYREIYKILVLKK
ncbi:MAG: hypothetical protein B6241_04715 [Spirochaetaceae bacterium 4572_59]|nr:MAG: hypothetical protein B6241_04715 [Spirochaetaceae bacterium 4572_59]